MGIGQDFRRQIRADTGDGTGAALKIKLGAGVFKFGDHVEAGTEIPAAASFFIGACNFAGDDFVDVMLNGIRRHAQRARDGAFARRTVRLEHHAVETEQRRATIDLRIHASADGLKGVFHEIGADLSFGVAHQFAFEHRKHRHGQGFHTSSKQCCRQSRRTQPRPRDPEQIMPFDIADEIHVQPLAELEGFERQFIALGIFRADAENAHARLWRPSTSRE